MSDFDTAVRLVYLASAVCFVLGLHLMNSPASARRGNQVSAAGMGAAIVVTFVVVAHDSTITSTGWIVLISGAALGTAAGLVGARRVAMTAMPQLVSLFNAVGGGGAALVAIDDVVRLHSLHIGTAPLQVSTTTALDVVIGAVTFSGSLVAVGKLQGIVPGRPLMLPGGRAVTYAIAAIAAAGAIYEMTGRLNLWVLIVVVVAALVFGVATVLPIGGADMPVVISLLNAFTGTAVAMAGFVIDSSALIIGGALVGASGGILTKLMADAMNRSIGNIMVGGFGTGDAAAAVAGDPSATVREVSADDVAIQLAYAARVIIVPGYGLAAAQAQHEISALADLLEDRGVDVSYAIHPVAGRMPGHMNVLLAEANVPYPQLKEMEAVNPEFGQADVALVVGANDVTNPAARRAGTAISGMPILDVDAAKSIVVIKRSMGHGYAGIDNELYANPKTGMFFTDAKAGIASLSTAVKSL
ncbi:MAG: NAD(P)(+) transhydrogenase (Re/Si-specific) subunit beta [Mycobacteriales bacterium]|nr:MAG: NAD(P) transhydrogenase subunit beta [Pseudonocardiales bacterium]